MSAPLPHVTDIICIASGKGGVGKSTVTVNVAAALVKQGKRVGILDADIFGPSQPRMLGVTDKPPVSDDGVTIIPTENHGVKLVSMGFMIAEDQPVVWRGPMVLSALKQMLHNVVWGTVDEPLDVLLIDMPPGTGDIQLSMAQQVPISGAVIVSTPQDIALLDAHKGLVMFQKVNIPILGMVENMSGYICPKCNEVSDIFGKGGAKQRANDLDVPFLGEVPLDLQIRQDTDEGRPLVISQPDGAQAKAFTAVATALLAQLADSKAKATGPVKIIIE